ncbi:MAG: hypothetical protein FDZ70_07415 [Actinobacteria bacterium]|nr:MAG: hypothetical protein FDZ70_07415 [Actinomycetota bacterium]
MGDDLQGGGSTGTTDGGQQDAGPWTPETAEPPAAEQAPGAGKRLGRKILIGVAIGALVLCAVVGAGAAMAGKLLVGKAERTEAVFERYNAIAEDLEDLEAAAVGLDTAVGDEAAAMEEFAEVAGPVLEATAAEIDEAVKLAEALDDSPSKEALVEAGTEAKEMAAAAQAVASEAKRLAGVMSLVDSATDELDAATDLMNSSIDNSNHEKWDAAKKDAAAAKVRAAAALKHVDALAAQNKDLDVATWRAVFVLQRDQIAAAADIADYGKRGRYNDLNKATDRYNDFNKRLNDAKMPDWLEDADVLLGELIDQSEQLVEHAGAFDEALARAEERINAGQY